MPLCRRMHKLVPISVNLHTQYGRWPLQCSLDCRRFPSTPSRTIMDAFYQTCPIGQAQLRATPIVVMACACLTPMIACMSAVTSPCFIYYFDICWELSLSFVHAAGLADSRSYDVVHLHYRSGISPSTAPPPSKYREEGGGWWEDTKTLRYVWLA